jgi:hypothetical protein
LRSRQMEDLWVVRRSGVGGGREWEEEEERKGGIGFDCVVGGGVWARGWGRSIRRTEAPYEARRRPQNGAARRTVRRIMLWKAQ